MSLDDQIPSKPVWVFTTAKPPFLSARFVYNYYEKDELINDNPTGIDHDNDASTEPQFPRKIELTFNPARGLQDDNSIGDLLLNNEYAQIVQQFASTVTSEVLLQSGGYIKYTSDTDREYSWITTDPSGAGEPTNKLDAFFTNASVTGEKLDGTVFANANADTTLYLNTSTNRPTSEGADIFAEKANESLIAADFCFDLIEASAANPFNLHGRTSHEALRELKLTQTKTRRITNPLMATGNQYSAFVSFLNLSDPTILSGLNGIGLLGYVIFKSQINPETNEIEKDYDCILVFDPDATSFEDHQVKYNKKYQYNLHPLLAVKTDKDSEKVFLMIGSRGKSCRIRAVESFPPPPVEAIKFTYLGNGNVALNWAPPTQYGELPNRVIGDIKGYQIFKRTTINQGFELCRHIDFNDLQTAPGDPMIANPEYIPRNMITFNNYHTTNYVLNLARDVEYIIAMCTIDAHYNSSNLSPQYRVRLNSATNTITVGFASFKGAPKQYPNMMMSKKIFVDSIKVSNKKNMTVYFSPKASHVGFSNASGDEDVVLSTAPSYVENRTDGIENSPAYRIQLINVSKQSDQVVDIFLKE